MRTDSTFRNGQAMIEFAIGMFVFALIVSALLAFGELIPKSIEYEYQVRKMAGYAAQGEETAASDGAWPQSVHSQFSSAIIDMGNLNAAEFNGESLSFTIPLEPLAQEYLFGDDQFRLVEDAFMPPMRIPNFEAGTAIP